jgi:hypothetical protein
MGVGMHIAYLGFPRAARIEADAGAQLVRIEPFSACLSDCHLAIEALYGSARVIYEARLDLITRSDELIAIEPCMSENPEAAVRAAFDAAERELKRRAARSNH